MEEHLNISAMPRPSFLSSVDPSPRTGAIDASDIKKNLCSDFSLRSDTSQRDSLESKERIFVCLRIRPLMQSEPESDSQECISVLDATSVILKAPQSSRVFRLSEKNLGQIVQKFTFSQVFGPKTTQEDLFEGAVKQPVLDFLKGHSRLVFTYGVTNAGKTYTYQGTEENSGILPRALDMLFKHLERKLYPEMDLKPHRCREHRRLTKEEVREEMSAKNSLLRFMKEVEYPNINNGNLSRTTSNSEGFEELVKEDEYNIGNGNGAKFSIWISFCEIYNECIYDLLLPLANDRRRKVLRLAQDTKGCSYVKDLQWIQVSNFKEAFKLMKVGLKHQSFASTKLNANSSRSHSIFTVKMLKIDSQTTRVMQVNELFLCDLAGSECCTRTHNEGERLKESGNINTSLLILGKCIGALKMSQQSKLQQHIPFRESKLTHFFQGFFSGKGKVCMIVNVSKNAAEYDETLNVLRFSAIAQKVMVLDSSCSPPEDSCEPMSALVDSEMNIDIDTCLPIKRTTILWERTLEDVMEDDEVQIEESGGVHDVNCVADKGLAEEAGSDMIDESPSQAEDEDSEVVITKERYQRLLDVIEDLKNRLIREKKEKLLMELRIRDEVIQEYSKYSAEREKELQSFVDHKQTIVEDNCEKRMQIYKELLKDCIPPTNSTGGEGESQVTQSDTQDRETKGQLSEDLSCMVESLQDNVADIKQQAEKAFRMLDTLEEPQTTIEQLEKQLAEVTAELSKVQLELLNKNQDLAMQENKLSESVKILQDATKKMALQNKRIQELNQVVEQKDDEISRMEIRIIQLETVIKDFENTTATIKQEMEEGNLITVKSPSFNESTGKGAYIGRKRHLETEGEGPPSKQGLVNNSSKNGVETKETEEKQPHTQKEKGEKIVEVKNKMLETELASLREELENVKRENEEFSRKVVDLSLKLSSSEEKASGLNTQLQQQEVSFGKITSELLALKAKNKGQEERIQTLLQGIEAASQNINEKEAVEIKVSEPSKLGTWGCSVEFGLTNLLEKVHGGKEGLEHGENSSFHYSIEAIWEMSKQIIQSSSKKSSQIEGLLQQVEHFQRQALDAEGENTQLKLKLSEAVSQSNACLLEKECFLKQLKDLQQENSLYAEKCKEEENRARDYLEKIKNNNDLLEEYRSKEASFAHLEQVLKDKESVILVMEAERKDLQEKINISESKVERLIDQESQLKAEIVELRDKLRSVELQEKDKERLTQAMEQLGKELSESTSLSTHLQTEIRQKDEEYADLKEKLADAKKQIEQVQRQVCSMRAEEKMLRNRVNELEKAKNQLTEELDIKQRTIQEFKKEELRTKLENITQQYQKACNDLCFKEKIIEDMKLTLEEQEQTQSDQDQLLEAKLEENERLMAELDECQKRYHTLEKQNNNLGEENGNVRCEKSTEFLNEELRKLQEKLKECEEQHKTNHKKWLAEKTVLINQVKEAEVHRNREMKKFAGDREQQAKQLIEAQKLVAEKEDNLQKWRIERDQLVAALEVQLNSLVSSNAQKDREIEELRKTILNVSGAKDCKVTTEEYTKKLSQISCESSIISSISKGAKKNATEQLAEKQNNLLDDSNGETASTVQRESSVENIQDLSDSVIDSCEVSSQSDQASRFPKPEMEIQFTPLQPNKIEVKHQGSPSSVTIKMPRTRKRKSSVIEEEFLKNENEKNTSAVANANIRSDSITKQNKTGDPYLKRNYPLRSKHLASSMKLPGNSSGTLQKFGSFLQSSPTILQSKAKKLMATIKSPKSTEEESVKENDVKPKRKRRLYTTNISSPMEISGHVIVMDRKESDHEIIKRRLRTKQTR